MYLWRNLPDGQLLAVLRWMSSRRAHPAGPKSPAEALAVSPTAAGKETAAPLR